MRADPSRSVGGAGGEDDRGVVLCSRGIGPPDRDLVAGVMARGGGGPGGGGGWVGGGPWGGGGLPPPWRGGGGVGPGGVGARGAAGGAPPAPPALPMATTPSPTESAEESPIGIGLSPEAPWIWMTAMS